MLPQDPQSVFVKKTVFLDLDDTLLDFHLAEHIAIKATFEAMGAPSDDATIAKYSKINKYGGTD